MPIIVNPSFVWPPEVDPVVSPDGRVTVVVDPAHAGVLLRADYSDSPGVARVRFEREDGTAVRSGDPAWAPGGWAHAYDHEARLGGGQLWRAVPIGFDGVEGVPSQFVSVVIPDTTDGLAWLKPVAEPQLSMQLRVEPPDFGFDGRVAATSIAGSRQPAVTWDVLQGHTSQLRALICDRATEAAFMRLLDVGPVLAQFPYDAGVEDFYFIRESVQVGHEHWDGYPWRRYQVEITQIDRPASTDASFRMPGLSYDTVAVDWTSYTQLTSTVDSYNQLLEQ